MKKILLSLSLATLAACSHQPLNPAAGAIAADSLLQHIRTLASDEFEGRLPGTRGEEKTVAYLTREFRRLGLEPGNPDGTFVQKVPLVGITGTAKSSLTIAGQRVPFKSLRDYVATTARFLPEVRVAQSPLVFVGYGIQAPEYGWDDYKGLDVRGKTLVMLINDPAGDKHLFKGRAMTYYGRWTYKYEIASKLGAAAVLIVHEDEPASYPWSVVTSSWTGEQFELAAADGNRDSVPVQGWVTRELADRLFSGSGLDFEAQKRAAQRADFQPVALDARASFTVSNRVRYVKSRNILARLPGSDPAHAGEHVIYTAHWDHLGHDRSLKGDGIYNGAVDNASGTAALIEIARAYRRLPAPPKRSVLFLAVTAEEQGLLGSAWYARNPLYPLETTMAVLNMDALNVWGRTRDVQVIGQGQNTIEDVLEDVAATQGRVLVGDTQTEKGFYYRSDQFNFAKAGVPALYADGGIEVLGQPEDWGVEKGKEYTRLRYHKPADEVQAEWDLSGMTEDLQMLFETGRRVANVEVEDPTWKRGSEFKQIREQSLARQSQRSAP